MDTKQGQGQLRMLGLVRSYLIRARVARQTERIHRDFLAHERYNNVVHRKAMVCKDEAQSWRRAARGVLIAYERVNGRCFAVGLPYYPLKDFLGGACFREWMECRQEYARIPFPLAVDPE